MTSGVNSLTVPLEQPQGLCDLVGMAFRIWRRNLKLIFRSLILPTIFLYTCAAAIQWCFVYGMASFSGKSPDVTKMVATGCLGLVAFTGYFISLAWLSLQQLAMVRLFNGFAADWPKALAFARKKLWWILGLFFISATISSVVMGIWICVIVLSAVAMGAMTAAGGAGGAGAGAILGVIGMCIGMLGLFVSLGLLLLVCMMGFSVLACEETTFFGVVGQAFSWTFKNFGRVLCFGFIYYVIFTAVTIPVSLPVLIASIADAAFHQIKSGVPATDYKASLAVMFFIQGWEGVCSLLLRPVTAICFGLLYLDLRRRVEGLDMSRKLRELKLAFDGAEHGIQGH